MQPVLDFLLNLVQTKFIEILTLILWGVYVWFTIKTFNQIKRQTELQSRSFLVVTPKTIDYMAGVTFTNQPHDMYKKWKQILSGHLPDVECKPEILQLKFTNRGKSDIIKWEIKINVKVSPGEYLRKQRNTLGSQFDFIIKSHSSDLIPPDGVAEVNIMPIGCYPQTIITWEITYSDIMNGNYYTTNNENPLEILNALAFQYSSATT